MKMKYIVGALVIVAVGAGVYYICKKSEDKENDTACDAKVSENDNISEPIAVNKDTSEDIIEKEIIITEEKKAEMQESIVARHQEAAIQMENSLKNILDESSLGDVASENDDDLTEMDDALDKLFDE